MQRRRRWAITAWIVMVLAAGIWQIGRGSGGYWAVFTVTFVGGYLLLVRLSDRHDQL